MAKQGLTIKIDIDGLPDTMRALKNIPKDGQRELRTRTFVLSQDIADKAKAAGTKEGRQAALVATTVKARRDRLPVVVAGGNKKLGSNKKPAYKLLFGSEFGATYLKQYKPHLGRDSYWFFKTVDDNREVISDAWNDVADAIISEFGKGG